MMPRTFATCLLVAAAAQAAFAEPAREKPRDPTAWHRLDPSKPEHAAILGWHKALISGDYAAYRKYASRVGKQYDTMPESTFNAMRQTAPTTTILFAPSATRTNSNGSTSYTVAGCGPMLGFDQPVRLVALVITLFEDGDWKVTASGFSMPWNNLVRICPEESRQR